MNKTIKNNKVIICGAGIGGLTVAHELAKRGVDVVIYERHPIIGGLARSKYQTYRKHEYPIEYSWRVYGSGYRNLLRILGEIPLRESGKKTVLHNLREVWTYIFPRVNKSTIVIDRQRDARVMFDFSWREKFKILGKLFYCLTMSRQRMDSFDDLKWKDFCADLSPEAKKYLVKLWGPVLGMDPTHMSFPVIARFADVALGGYSHAASSLFLTTKPTNDAWFDEWAAFLQKTGKVTIQTNVEIVDLPVLDGKITKVVLRNLDNQEIFEDQADDYVCAMSVESIAKIVQKNSSLASSVQLQKTVQLARRGRQVQLSVQIFLDQQLPYSTVEPPILYLPDSPWALIIEPQDLVWGQTYCSNPQVKSVLSVGICQTDVPGTLHKKDFTKCTPKEVQTEVWAQLVASFPPANKAKVLHFVIWPTYSYNRAKKALDTVEPKFSNNAGTLKYQPTCETELKNLWFATGYTQTDRFIYSMESAAEAGTRCANAIARQLALPGEPSKIFPFVHRSVFLQPFIVLDRILFAFRLPHLFSPLRGRIGRGK